MKNVNTSFAAKAIVALVFLFAAALCLGAPQAEAAQYDIKVGHESAPDSMQDQFAKKFKEYVERESKGEIAVSVFPSDQLGDPFALLQGVQSGVMELGIFNGGSIATILKDYALFSIPAILPKEPAKTKKIFESDFVKTLTSSTEKTGVKYLGSYIEPFFQVTANKIVEKPEDFKGLKIRTMNSPIIIATYRALGANPTPIPFSEVYSGLQTRLIDAQENPLDIIYEMSFYEVQKYLMLTSHSTVINFLCINTGLLEGMSPELQKIVDGLGMAGFLALEEETLLSLRNEAAPRVIITGGSAVFGEKAMAWHKENGVLVYLRLPLEILARRVNFESGGLAKAPGQTFRDVFAQRSPLYAALADIAVDVRDKSREEVVDAIMAGIENAGLWGVQ